MDFPMVDKVKNEGDLLFGSFARRVEQLNDNPLLYREELMPAFLFFEPKSVEVTVSDDALTNIRQCGRDYLIVPLKEG
jgi:hypothetical protein